MASVSLARSVPGSTSTIAPSKFNSPRSTIADSAAVPRTVPEALRSSKGTTSSCNTPIPVTVSRMGVPSSAVAT